MMTIDADQVRAVESAHVLKVYNRLPVVFVRGEGSRLFDSEGKEYLDLLSGIGVAALGHAHAGLADAISAQARELLHTSNLLLPSTPRGGRREAHASVWIGPGVLQQTAEPRQSKPA